MTSYSGKTKIKLCKGLGNDWQDLANYFEIPIDERSQFEQGRECQALWEWLKERDKLQELSEALKELNRQDLLSFFEETEKEDNSLTDEHSLENEKGNHPDHEPPPPPNRKKSSETVIGKNQRDLLTWLRDKWMHDGSTVCFVEGFSGVGKTQVARVLLESMEVIGTRAVRVDMPDMETNSIDDLLLDLASELKLNNYRQLAHAVDKGQDLFKAFEQLLFFNPVLIIIDEFQRALMPGSAKPMKRFAGFLEKLGRRPQQKGRLLLLSNRSMERGQWLENHKVRTLFGLTPTEAEKLLDDLLAERADEVPLTRRREVVNALACNPRALHVFVECLRREPLNELLGAIPDLWSVDDREISADLLYRLEKALLERTLVHINEEIRLFLEHIVVYRKSVKQNAFEKMANSIAKAAQCRNELIDRFLIEWHKEWYSFNPVVREIVLHSLNEQALRRAHSLAADYYTRHFLSEQIVKTGGGGELGGQFVEARFHLVRAGREEALQTISTRFEQYLRATIKRSFRPPQNEIELNERIALLSGLLEHGSMKGWEYHLARCYQTRHYPGDIEKALQHLRKATDRHAPKDTWLLRVILEDEIHGVDKALTVTKEGLRQISANKGVELYQSCGELLARDNRFDEAINLLREGIQKIPADKNLFSLYKSCGELLARDNRFDEAINLLREGIQKIPANKNLVELYQSCGELLARDNRIDEAINLLREGIQKISVDKNLVELYQSFGKLLARDNRIDEAINLLREGIQKIPADKNLFSLYQSCGELLARDNRFDEAIHLLRKGIQKIPVDKNLHSLYQSCGELLARDNRIDEAINLLREGIQKIPADKELRVLYQSCGELLARDNRIDSAINLLREGIQKIPADKNLYSLYQSGGELLARAARPQEAIEFLIKGMQVIPVGKWGRESLTSSAFYLSAAERDIQTIEKILAGQGKDAVEPQKIALGQLLRLQRQEQWQEAAKVAQTAREKFFLDLDLATQEAFSWLCAGEAKTAQQALERFPKEFLDVEKNPVRWLQAFIALKQDNQEVAQKFLAIYLNQSLNSDEPINEKLLLRFWDEDAMRGGIHPAFYFPHLPPSITGLPQSVTRKQYGSSALKEF